MGEKLICKFIFVLLGRGKILERIFPLPIVMPHLLSRTLLKNGSIRRSCQKLPKRAEFPCILRYFSEKSRKKIKIIFSNLIDYMRKMWYNITINSNIFSETDFFGKPQTKNYGTGDESFAVFTVFFKRMGSLIYQYRLSDRDRAVGMYSRCRDRGYLHLDQQDAACTQGKIRTNGRR